MTILTETSANCNVATVQNIATQSEESQEIADQLDGDSDKVLEFRRKPKEAVKHHCKASLEDLAWIREQPNHVQQVWLDCCFSEQFGNHSRLLHSSLKEKWLRKAIKIIEDKGLFKFEPIYELGKSARVKFVGWKVTNLHGHFRKSYWEKTEATPSRQRPDQKATPSRQRPENESSTTRERVVNDHTSSRQRLGVAPETHASKGVENPLPPSNPPLTPPYKGVRESKEESDGLTEAPCEGVLPTDTLEEVETQQAAIEPTSLTLVEPEQLPDPPSEFKFELSTCTGFVGAKEIVNSLKQKRGFGLLSAATAVPVQKTYTEAEKEAYREQQFAVARKYKAEDKKAATALVDPANGITRTRKYDPELEKLLLMGDG